MRDTTAVATASTSSGAGSHLTPAAAQRMRERGAVVTVAGDLMLDGWWSGRAERLTREAPAPVVEVTDRQWAPGGAANTAANLAALGAEVRVVGVVGDDEAGRALLSILTGMGVDTRHVVVADEVVTTTKTRIVAADHVLLRLDEVPAAPYPVEVGTAVAGALAAALAGADAVVVCDYGLGAMDPVTAQVLTGERRRRLVVVDAHDPASWSAVRPHVVTPNSGEVARVLGRGLGEDRVATVTAGAEALLTRTGADVVVATLDVEGSLTLRRHQPPHRTTTTPGPERHACGAGDTHVAALTLARVAGLSWPASADVAQVAAGVVAGSSGTAVCGSDQLGAALVRACPDPATEDLLCRLDAERSRGRRIVFTNGCFDLLHAGHTAYLEQARRLGDVLVVAVNSDESVRRLKGPDRPINTAQDRAAVLAALSCVDHVTIFETDTPIPLLQRLRPDVYAKGGDYIPEMLPEAAVVHGYGGEIRILDYVSDRSTSAMVARIRREPAPSPT